MMGLNGQPAAAVPTDQSSPQFHLYAGPTVQFYCCVALDTATFPSRAGDLPLYRSENRRSPKFKTRHCCTVGSLMARFGANKQALGRRYAVVLATIALLGVILVADFLWVSSSSTTRSSSVLSRTLGISADDGDSQVAKTSKKLDETLKSKKEMNATFFDLPGPNLEWEEMAAAPVPRLDGSAVQINNLFYVFAGYGTIDYVHSHVDIYNFSDNTWGGKFDMPKEMAHSHLGVASDGRYIYIISGQYGPQCRGPIARCFVLDTKTREWSDLPSLPAPRYAPATQIWRGRLHVMGGSKEDRHEPGLEHWSLAVKDGKPLESEWRSEIPVLNGGPHRACVVANDKLMLIGGQAGDFMAKPGSPIFKCARRSEVVYDDVYMLDDGTKWNKLPSMPKPNSHIEFAWVNVNNSLIIAGGTTDWHPLTKKMVLVGELFRFNLDTLEWSVIGHLPFRIKTTLVGFWDGWLYFTSGQRDKGPHDPSPKKVIGSMYRTKLHL